MPQLRPPPPVPRSSSILRMNGSCSWWYSLSLLSTRGTPGVAGDASRPFNTLPSLRNGDAKPSGGVWRPAPPPPPPPPPPLKSRIPPTFLPLLPSDPATPCDGLVGGFRLSSLWYPPPRDGVDGDPVKTSSPSPPSSSSSSSFSSPPPPPPRATRGDPDRDVVSNGYGSSVSARIKLSSPSIKSSKPPPPPSSRSPGALAETTSSAPTTTTIDPNVAAQDA